MTWTSKEETTGKILEYCNERATATQQTGFSFISQLRRCLPREIGGIILFGVDDATVYIPSFKKKKKKKKLNLNLNFFFFKFF
jgi:hypothetical protein